MKITSYLHHGKYVYVREDQKGKHREHCLCWECEHFNPDNREKNCVLANMVYALDQALDLVTPVWECPEFSQLAHKRS